MRGEGGAAHAHDVRLDGARFGVPWADGAARRSLSLLQTLVCLIAASGIAALTTWRPGLLGDLLVVLLATGFMAVSMFRMVLVVAARPRALPAEASELPRYAVLCALHNEADMVAQLIHNLERLDYPRDRLRAYLILEPEDRATYDAALKAAPPEWIEVLVAPQGSPKTKPRALNAALAILNADLLTVYDAEDQPHPGQLREAAARFAADRSRRLACLQAPLRIRRRATPSRPSPFLDRQFAVEYAALFETQLPGLARLGLPFPLGGTSNHFRVAALREAGGWDAYNVTEDADLGFRLWRHGWALDVLTLPTWETPPGDLSVWLPQRTRWLKGYMQTLGVHTRRPWRLGARGMLSLAATLGAGLAAAGLHGPSLAWASAGTLAAIAAGGPVAAPSLAVAVFGSGVASAWIAGVIGARRAGVPYSALDMLAAPAYWSMLSLAFVHAAWRLALQPFVWDKTPHAPDVGVEPLDAGAAPGLSPVHAAAPQLLC